MGLLQIAEPGMSVAPHQHRLAVGIDLGTTNSLVASVISGQAAVMCDERGRGLLPSVVRYLLPSSEATPIVGYEAKDSQSDDPCNTLSSIKRLMGRELADIEFAASLPYAFVAGAGMVHIATQAGAKNPVDVSADILRTLRLRAETTLAGELTGAVITVPAHFDDAQRQATKDAARMAGLKVLRLLNEPTAAAIAYGLDKAAEGLFAIYDLGGGTFDISILKLSRGVFEVLATNGDTFLGGDDFDRRIYDWIVLNAGLKVETLLAGDARYLLDLARSAKETLSINKTATIAAALADGRTVCLTLTQEILEVLASDLVARTLRPVRTALRDAGLSHQDIDGVVMVGGATRMPLVRAAVAEYFGQSLLTDIDPDQVVAIGAAIQANALVGNRSGDDWLLLDVCPLSLGVETIGGLTEKLIARNTTIPAACAQDFTTFKDGQTAMSFHVVQGERELVSNCRSLARFELRGIPPMVAGAAKIRVTFQIDADGLLSVSARELSSGVESVVTVKPSYGLEDATIAQMLQEAHELAAADMQTRKLREAQVEARRLLDATEAALRVDGMALLSPPERALITSHIYTVSDIIETGSAYPDGGLEALQAAAEALNQATQEFAARRMDANIQHALTGQTLDQVAQRLSSHTD